MEESLNLETYLEIYSPDEEEVEEVEEGEEGEEGEGAEQVDE